LVYKITSTIALIIEVIILFCFFIKSHDYYMTNNIWVEESDKFIKPIVFLVVMVLFVVVPLIISMVIANKGAFSAKKTKPNYAYIKKQNVSELVRNIISILFFIIITERIIFSLAIEYLSMDIFEAKYLAGHYEIFKNHFLIICIVSLINNVITIIYVNDYCNQPYNPSEPPYDNYNNYPTVDDTNRKKARRFLLIYLAIIIIVLIIMLVLLYIKTRPSIDIESFMQNGML